MLQSEAQKIVFPQNTLFCQSWKCLFSNLFYSFLLFLYSKIMFVLQIGSVAQTESCNIALDQADTVDRAVLLQYSINNGVSWHVIAQHQPKDFIKAQRVSYNIPL